MSIGRIIVSADSEAETNSGAIDGSAGVTDAKDNAIDAKAALAYYADMINEALPGFLPAPAYPESLVTDAMRYSLLGGGKRLRGSLVLAFFGLYEEDIRPALPFACAMEMVHAYSLIHDDLPCMDDDDIRRGKPSCHIAFGEATALLAGDALLTLAFELMSGDTAAYYNLGFPAERVLGAIRYLSAAAGVSGMIGGQVIDLEMEGKRADESLIARMYDKKTAALFRAACSIGCVLGGATEREIEIAKQYASDIGMAFQITDDILDITAEEAVLGKPVGSDRKNEKSTYVDLVGIQKAGLSVRSLTEKAARALSAMPGDVRFLIDLSDELTRRRS